MNSVAALAQIRKHIRVVIIIPRAGTLEGIEFGGGKDPGGNGQGDWLVKSLLAGETHPPLRSLVCMLIAVAAPAFYAFSQGWIFTTMWYKIPDDHFALFNHVHLIMKL